MPSIVTNFKFKSNAPNFERDQVKTKEELKIAGLKDYDRGHIVFCLEDDKHYSFATNKNKYSGNLIWSDETGYFTELRTGATGDDTVGEGSYRTVFAFKHSDTQPEKPSGWRWDPIHMEVIEPADPQGWTLDDTDLEPKIWMSIGQFSVMQPDKENWSTPVCVTGQDGRPGTDGTVLEYIYTRTVSEFDENGKSLCPPLPVSENVTDYIPAGWYDHPQGVSFEYQCEWMCQRYKYDHRTDEEIEAGAPEEIYWGGWNETMEEPKPILWSKYGVMGKDGDGIEYVFNLTADNTAPKLPAKFFNEDGTWNMDYVNSSEYQADEQNYIYNDKDGDGIVDDDEFDEVEGSYNALKKLLTDAGWTDDPQGTTPEEPYEWVSMRKFNRTTGKWGKFSDPTIWAHYGKDGFKSFVFCRSNSKPQTPVDGEDTSYLNPIPVDPQGEVTWEDGVPAMDNNDNTAAIIWMSSKVFYNDATDKERAWTDPSQISDTADFDVCFNDMEEHPSDPTTHGSQGGGADGWYDPGWKDAEGNVHDGSNAIWMATSKCKNGEWSAWTIVKIKGEKGDNGTSVNILGRYGNYEELVTKQAANELANNPPIMGDAYVVSVINVDDNGDWIDPYGLNGTPPTDPSVVPNPTNPGADPKYIQYGILFTWDGDSWACLGAFQGEAAYVHVKYSPNPDVMNIKWIYDDKSGTYIVDESTKLTKFPMADLWELPVNSDGRVAKYYGMYADHELKDSTDVNKYKWTKFIGEDGFGYEYIYMLSKTEIAPYVWSENTESKDYQTNGYCPKEPEGWADKNKNYKWWTDEPSGPTEEYPYEWMIWRTWTQGVDKWSEWKGSKVNTRYDENTKKDRSLAILHQVWTDAGFTSFAFTRTNNDLSNWDMSPNKQAGYFGVSGTYKNPLPTQLDEDGILNENNVPGVTYWGGNDENSGIKVVWSDSAPAPVPDEDGNINPYEIIWMTSAKFNLSMDGINYHPVWSKPRAMTDTADLDIDWCPYSETTPIAITNPGDPDTNPELWWESAYVGTSNKGETPWPHKDKDVPYEPVWMATRKLKNGKPIDGEKWVITRVKGEQGEKGMDGTSVKILGKFDHYTDLISAYENAYLVNNPPMAGDAYVMNKGKRDGETVEYSMGDMFVWVPTAGENGEWMNVGQFTGDPGKPAYTHIKYWTNDEVLNKPVNDGSQTYFEKLEEYNNKFIATDADGSQSSLLLEEPIQTIKQGEVTYNAFAKYIGIYSDNTFEDSIYASDYKWNKNGGDDGWNYEYIYRRSKIDSPFDVLEEEIDTVEYQKDDHDPIKPDGDTSDTWWEDRMYGVNQEYPYEYMLFRRKYTHPDGVYKWGKWEGGDDGKAVLVNFFSKQEYTTIHAIDVSPLAITINKYGEYSSDKIYVSIFSKNGEETVKYTDGIPADYTIKMIYGEGIREALIDDGGNVYFNISDIKEPSVNIELWNGDNRIDIETIPILKEDGNLVADLTNDNYAITCDAFGQPVNQDEVASTTFKMYYGLDEVALNVVTVECGDAKVTVSSNNKSGEYEDSAYYKVSANLNDTSCDISVSNLDEVTPIASNFIITGYTTIDGEEYSKSIGFIVQKVQPGGLAPTLYQLTPSTSSIKLDANSGVRDPKSITLSLTKISGNSGNSDSDAKVEVLDELPEGFTIIKTEDGTIGNDKITLGSSIDTKDADQYIKFELKKETGTIHDIYIPVIKTGLNGTDGESPIIYKLNPNVSTIRLSGDTYSTTSVNVKILKIVGNEINEFNSIEGYSIYYIYDDISAKDNPVKNNIINWGSDSTKPKTMVTIELRRNGDSKVIDKVNIPIVSDGVAGQTTTIYSINVSNDIIKVGGNGDDNESITPSYVYATILQNSGESLTNFTDVSQAYPMFCLLNLGSESQIYNKKGVWEKLNISSFPQGYNNDNYRIPVSTDISTAGFSGKLALEYYLYKCSGDANLNNSYTLLDKESIPILRDGKIGKDSLVMDLSNEMIAFQADSDGILTGSKTGSTTVSIYYGTTPVTPFIDGISTANGIESNTSGSTITFTGSNAMADSNVITINAHGKLSDGTILPTLSKTITIVKVKQGAKGDTGEPGAPGDKGEPGDKGNPGALARNLGKWSEISNGTRILSGSGTEKYIDFVLDDNEENPIAYQCLKTHSKSIPLEGHKDSKKYWLKSDSFKFVSTQLLNANQIVADVIQNNHSIVTNVIGDIKDGEWTGVDDKNKIYTKVVTKDGFIRFYYSPKNIGVNDDGWTIGAEIGYGMTNGEAGGVLKFYENGVELYNLGPRGLIATGVKSPYVNTVNYYSGRSFFDMGDGGHYSIYDYYHGFGMADDPTLNNKGGSDFNGSSSLLNFVCGCDYKEKGSLKFNHNPVKIMKYIELESMWPQWSCSFASVDPSTGDVINREDKSITLTSGSNSITVSGNSIGYVGYKKIKYSDIILNFAGQSGGKEFEPKRVIDIFIPSPTGVHEFNFNINSGPITPGLYEICTGPTPLFEHNCPFAINFENNSTNHKIVYNTNHSFYNSLHKLAKGDDSGFEIICDTDNTWPADNCIKSVQTSLDVVRKILNQLIEDSRISTNNPLGSVSGSGGTWLSSGASSAVYYCRASASYPELMLAIEIFNVISSGTLSVENQEFNIGYLFPGDSYFKLSNGGKIEKSSGSESISMQSLFAEKSIELRGMGNYKLGDFISATVRCNNPENMKGYIFIASKSNALGSNDILTGGTSNVYSITIKANNTNNGYIINCYPIDSIYAGLMSSDSISRIADGNILTKRNNWLQDH